MDNKLRNLLGLLDTGKRVYQLKDGEVSRADFEYCVVLNQILFGEKGLVDTLGPTWDMVHDPRFETMERFFIVERPTMFGGENRAGVQRQQKDGTFDNSMAAIEQYAEILGEGRNMIGMLRSRAILEATEELFPDRSFRINERDSHGPLALVAPYTPKIREALLEAWRAKDGDLVMNWDEIAQLDDYSLGCQVAAAVPEVFATLGILDPVEKQQVNEQADTYQMYKPQNFKFWPEDEMWKIIFAEYTNYFKRNGEPNPLAVTLFKLFKADLLGLIQDYAEVANVQETVLLEDTAELYDPEKHGAEADRVSMEVEHLERALTYRSELRVTAYQILCQLGVAAHAPELTDFERDNLLKLIYTSDFIDDKPGTVTKILGFLAGIRISGKSVQEREFEQLTAAALNAGERIAGLKDGSIQPISRYSEETVAFDWTPEELMVQRILANPIAGYTFSRLSNIEKRIEIASEQFAPYKRTASGAYEVDSEGNKIPENPAKTELLADWIFSTLHPEDAVVFGPEVTDAYVEQLKALDPLLHAQAILRPVFEDASFEWTDDVAAELLTKVEQYDPTPELQVAQGTEGTDPGAPTTWTN